jgi:hypothetical protein
MSVAPALMPELVLSVVAEPSPSASFVEGSERKANADAIPGIGGGTCGL